MLLRLIRLFTLIVTFVCISSATLAISLGELQNSPQFWRERHSSSVDVYLDLNSIQSTLYNPPKYTLKFKVYTVDKKDKYIGEGNVIADYDYNKSIEGIIKRNNLAKMPYNSEKVKSTVKKAKLKDSGIVNSLKVSAIYDFNGKEIYSGNPIKTAENIKVDATSSGYILSVKAFKQYYKVTF
ncbi:hypothetical protein [uncultured Veillonella sp.]|uniref:hypothetical protein n=1 Tax=uncultured Veillonella sp. TaxID=159268 RepID=UPI0025E38D92|nr:hypothetical protein [uncultured Veillonella sp.]